jgi:hypothetical protein
MKLAQVAAYRFIPSSLIPFTLMMEAVCSSQMSVRTRATRRHFPESCILHCYGRENLRSYTL